MKKSIIVIICLLITVPAGASTWKALTGTYNSAGDTDKVRIDSATNTLQTIEYEHHEIHSGSSYTAKFENVCTNTGERTAIVFTTPNTTKWLHLVATGSVSSIARLSIGENASPDADVGTQLAIYNRDRNNAATSDVYSIASPPVEGYATSYNETQEEGGSLGSAVTLDTLVIGAPGANPSRAGIGGLARAAQEWILKQDETYVFMIESLDDSDNYHTIELNWYEHTNVR